MHEIYLNTAVTTEREITKLMEYFRNTDENTEDFGPLSEKVRYYKKDQKGKMIMCDKVQRLIDEASEEKDRKIAKVTMERNRAVAERKRMAAEKNRAVAEKNRAVVENRRMAAEIKYLKAQLAEQESRL